MFYKSTFTALASLVILSNCSTQQNQTAISQLDFGNDLSATFGPATRPKKAHDNIEPAAQYAKQYWVHPNACSYSRAQAPGYKPTWHLILNPYHIGMPPAHRGCAAMITQTTWTGGYLELGE